MHLCQSGDVTTCGGIHVEDLIPVPDAAELIGSTRWTLNRRIEAGKLESIQCGSVRLVRRADVLALSVRSRVSNPIFDGTPVDDESSAA